MQVFGAVLVLTGVSVGLVALVALHLLPTGLSPTRNAVSQYGISAYRSGYRVQTIAYGVAGLGAAIGLGTLRGSAALVVLCVLFAVSRLAISWFPMDEPGTTVTTSGRRHGLLAICAFGAMGVAAEVLHNVLHADHLEPRFATASRVLALLMLATFLGMGIARRTEGRRYFGLVERGFYLCMTAWLVVAATLLLTVHS